MNRFCKGWVVASLVAGTALGWTGWMCRPQQGGPSEPWVAVAHTEEPMVVKFAFSQDLIREPGRLPMGEYEGVIRKSQSGFSYFASLNVKDFFSSKSYPGVTPWLTVVLPTQPTGMVSEGWIFWGDPNGEYEAESLNHYGCRLVH